MTERIWSGLDRDKRDKRDAVGEEIGLARRNLQGEPRFANPARSQQCEQATSRIPEQSGDRGQFGVTADAGGWLVRQS